ncbi:MAG: 16S rRNA (guanine(966)-N(2))-methyltransferase RsmD [Tannerellaceae bacterium]|jgi:16S rRNA (guanine(966)-N(2))-methyltransferase RsmD|nr:16S rRNA (guanine(966)-N(2))-methyltransferase RsmD [Tannerellaceae bacterium]
MRIISGIYGRRRFPIPSNFSARPTTDFAKENLFNVLANLIDLDGTEALDLFAGTGSIAFELISRGCARVTAIENDRAHAAFIAKVAAELQTSALQLICTDAYRFVRKWKGQAFDFIFADPPYKHSELTTVPQLVLGNRLLKDGGLFVMEHSAAHNFADIPDLHGFFRQLSYGSVNFSLFRR